MLTEEEAEKIIRENVKEVLDHEGQDGMVQILDDPKRSKDFFKRLKEEIHRYTKRSRERS